MYRYASMRYVLHPGYIRSKHDGDRHYITAKDLARLYKVNMCDCIVYYDGYIDSSTDIHLYPKYDGNYNLPARLNDG